MGSEPIKPNEVSIDRECEYRWMEYINEKLSEHWEGNEVRRVIDIEGQMSNDSQLARWIQQQYSDVGWNVSSSTPFKAPDKYVSLIFIRPCKGG